MEVSNAVKNFTKWVWLSILSFICVIFLVFKRTWFQQFSNHDQQQ